MGFFKKKNRIYVPVITEEVAKETQIRCPSCGRLINYKDLKNNLNICPYCGHHFRMSIQDRINLLADAGTFEAINSDIEPLDVLNFYDGIYYKNQLAKVRQETGLNSAIITGEAKIDGIGVAMGAFSFEFIGGSLGYAVGEKLVRLFDYAKKNQLPVVVKFSSGGERIQEGVFSMLQVIRVVQAIDAFKESGGLFISLLTNPVYGGASVIGMLGQFVFAERDTMVGLTSPKIIELAVGMTFNKELQSAEKLLENGFIDGVLERKDLKSTVSRVLKIYTNRSIV
jgi:acetyl-CoA carboxylase carboxyl transferase subunit beta